MWECGVQNKTAMAKTTCMTGRNREFNQAGTNEEEMIVIGTRQGIN
jgi:hypothetical protein